MFDRLPVGPITNGGSELDMVRAIIALIFLLVAAGLIGFAVGWFAGRRRLINAPLKLTADEKKEWIALRDNPASAISFAVADTDLYVKVEGTMSTDELFLLANVLQALEDETETVDSLGMVVPNV